MGTVGVTMCTGHYTACASRPAKRTTSTLRTRLITFPIALAALYVIFSGERWVLEHSPSAANELIVATCAADTIFGDAGSGTGCIYSVRPNSAKENEQGSITGQP